MSTDLTDEIFGFLAGGPSEKPIRRALVRPGTDSDADAALTRFRADHKDLSGLPGVAASNEKARRQAADLWDDLRGVVAGVPELRRSAPQQARPTWRDLFDTLLDYCRSQLGPPRPADRSADTAEGMVSTIVSSYIAGDDAGKYHDLRDPKKIWPVLLEIAARKMKRPLEAKTVGDPKFAGAVEQALKLAFRTEAKDDRERTILGMSLLGHPLDKIVPATKYLPEDVEGVLRALHARLRVHLAA